MPCPDTDLNFNEISHLNKYTNKEYFLLKSQEFSDRFLMLIVIIAIIIISMIIVIIIIVV